jgi:hypothetical protein
VSDTVVVYGGRDEGRRCEGHSITITLNTLSHNKPSKIFLSTATIQPSLHPPSMQLYYVTS